mmetsp:Transcript_46518/g.129656  ORF Transcript_46518/g.129656 Transcript_46518/m.129656 type:complete len:101 (+) Transcript_46518:113-415(+)
MWAAKVDLGGTMIMVVLLLSFLFGPINAHSPIATVARTRGATDEASKSKWCKHTHRFAVVVASDAVEFQPLQALSFVGRGDLLRQESTVHQDHGQPPVAC